MLNEQIAANVGPSGIEIAYERRGNPTDPVVLLTMGLAAQPRRAPLRIVGGRWNRDGVILFALIEPLPRAAAWRFGDQHSSTS